MPTTMNITSPSSFASPKDKLRPPPRAFPATAVDHATGRIFIFGGHKFSKDSGVAEVPKKEFMVLPHAHRVLIQDPFHPRGQIQL